MACCVQRKRSRTYTALEWARLAQLEGPVLTALCGGWSIANGGRTADLGNPRLQVSLSLTWFCDLGTFLS